VKIKVELKAKVQFGSMNIGEILVLYNDVFNLDTGIAYYSIDKDTWEVISVHMATGLVDGIMSYNEKII
jgi:hypothetical protein